MQYTRRIVGLIGSIFSPCSGTFLVRSSDSLGCVVLTVKTGKGKAIKHFPISQQEVLGNQLFNFTTEYAQAKTATSPTKISKKVEAIKHGTHLGLVRAVMPGGENSKLGASFFGCKLGQCVSCPTCNCQCPADGCTVHYF